MKPALTTAKEIKELLQKLQKEPVPVVLPKREILRMKCKARPVTVIYEVNKVGWEEMHKRGIGTSLIYHLLQNMREEERGPHQVILAGGSLRKFFNPKEEIQDYDLFVAHSSLSRVLTYFLESLLGKGKDILDGYYQDKGCAHEFMINGVKYQVIPFVPFNIGHQGLLGGISLPVGELLSSFDFRVNSLAWDGEYFHYHPDSAIVSLTPWSLEILKQFPIEEGHLEFRVRLFQRALKLMALGYPCGDLRPLYSKLMRNINIPPSRITNALRTDSSRG